MDKDFLTNLGVEGDAAEAILSEIGRSEEELFGELSDEARNLRISIAAKESGARDEELLRLVIGDAPDIAAAVKSAKKTHGWLFGSAEAPVFSAATDAAENNTNPFAHGAGLN